MSDKRKGGRERKGGNPTTYTEAIGNRLCDMLADGQTLFAICKLQRMPDERTVRRWAQDPDHPFAERYSQAREIGYLKMADQLVALADDMSIEINNRRLMVDTRKFVLMKCLPKFYGDKIVNNSISVGEVNLHNLPMDDTARWLKAITTTASRAEVKEAEEATTIPCSSSPE